MRKKDRITQKKEKSKTLQQKCKDIFNQSTTGLNKEECNITSVYPPYTPVVLSSLQEDAKWFCNEVYYISDIHLTHKVECYFKGQKVTDSQVLQYIKQLARSLFTERLIEELKDGQYPAVFFGGDTSSLFYLAEIFFTEFIDCWKKYSEMADEEIAKCIYAVLGNHDFWNFETGDECYSAYTQLFSSLHITFLNNSIVTLPERSFIMPQPKSIEEYNRYEQLSKQFYSHRSVSECKIMLVGGTGFAGKNLFFNADKGIYGSAYNRDEEITETEKWVAVYRNALYQATKQNCTLLVLTHNPLSDWNDSGPDTNCIYFTGHNHINEIHHDDNSVIHIYADNQIGYQRNTLQLRKALIYGRRNPFAAAHDGYHKVGCEEYLQFYDYLDENISGTRTIQRFITKYGCQFYMIKKNGYYGFFLVSNSNSYICNGGNIKKTSVPHSIDELDSDFISMVSAYESCLSTFRSVQENVSSFIKIFGGSGRIHGCIIDIDFENHVMLNPQDGSITYYHSPTFGKVKTYSNLYTLLQEQCQGLSESYFKILKGKDEALVLLPTAQAESSIDYFDIDIKNSIYALSIRLSPLQRLFDKKLLRDWDDGFIREYKKLP